jgi:hypothetical protein
MTRMAATLAACYGTHQIFTVLYCAIEEDSLNLIVRVGHGAA